MMELSKMIALIKRNFLTHIVLAYVYLSSGVIINAFQVLTLPLWILGFRETYRQLIGRLNYMSWSLIPAVAQWWAGIDCYLYGHVDDIKMFGKEKAIAVLNHKSQLDWVMSWVVSDHCNILENAKCTVKNILSFIPIFGWGFWFGEYIFLKRKLDQDRITLRKGLQALTTYSQPFWMLIFCEGTRFTPEKHKRSNEFAVKNGLKPLKQHLTPRTKGFYLISQELRDTVVGIYDATLRFRNKEPVFSDLLNGKPSVADFMIRKIPISEVPTTEEECAKFVYDIYAEKDEICEYHQQHNCFPIGDANPKYKDYVRRKIDKNLKSLCNLIFWSVVTLLPLVYYTYNTLTSGSTYEITVFAGLFLFVTILFYSMLEFTKPLSKYGKSK